MINIELIGEGIFIIVNLIGYGIVWGKVTQKMEDIDKKQESYDRLDTKLDELAIKFEQVKTSIFGIDGQNGLRSEVRDIGEKLDALIKQLTGL